jgi:glycyl-tRNA synthetase beta chain
MPNLLLELFSEEIPSWMQRAAAEAIEQKVFEALCTEMSNFEWSFSKDEIEKMTFKKFYTARRIAIYIANIPEQTQKQIREPKGPRVNAPDAAIDGFCKANSITRSDLQTQSDGKNEFYIARIEVPSQKTVDVLKPILDKVIASYTWPKSMRWGAYEQSWVRPLQNICCLLDGAVVPVSFAHITANNKTFGHRFMAPDEITLNSPTEYEAALEKAFVIADADKRKKLIADGMSQTASALGLEVVEDAALLEEVTGLVEWPVILQGRIGDNFMDLPPEVLRSEMRNHQKYFNLRKANAEGIAPEFVLASNLIASDGGTAIISGNERVLRARLADGRFYWDQDRKKPLGEWAKGLENMVFHAKIGHMAYRVERIEIVAKELCKYILAADAKKVQRAASLCKADLTSGMVGEFPELQGIMGRYYAQQQNEHQEVADAVRDHYLPLGPQSPCPIEPTAYIVSLADKLDSLTGLFAIGDKPTGSKDPYALRRAALGVIRIILENKLRLPLKSVLGHALTNYINLATKTQDNDAILQDLLSFFADRLKVMLKDQGIRHDLVAAVFTAEEDDIFRVANRAQALARFVDSEDGINLLSAYKRAANILRIEEKKDGAKYNTAVDAILLQQAEEAALHKALAGITSNLPALLKAENYEAAMTTLSTLRTPLDAFFDKVTVNTDDATLRKNRLLLLGQITGMMESVADFAVVEG